ncbi:hypothetical protein ADUPG1_011161, partial [Aduncisulcus paluster]
MIQMENFHRFIHISSLFFVYISDDSMRNDICDCMGLGNCCDPSRYDMAAFSGNITLGENNNVDSLTGFEPFLSVTQIDAGSTSITSISPLSKLTQLTSLDISHCLGCSSDSLLYTIPELKNLTRLQYLSLSGNPISDISPTFTLVELSSLFLNSIYLCHSEDNDTFVEYLATVFPLLDTTTSDLTENACPINPENEYSCDGVDECPSFIRNEVYGGDSIFPTKECADIAKTGKTTEGDLICYTIFDDNIRAYLIDTYDGIAEDNGMISVGSLRSMVTGSLSIPDIEENYGEVSTLRGLEFATNLTELILDGYQFIDWMATFDHDILVVKTLVQSTSYTNDADQLITTGLKSLSMSDCNLNDLRDVFDFSPIISDTITTPFRLESLDLSNNQLSDFTWLLSSDLFDADTLVNLYISGNYVCGAEDLDTAIANKFENLGRYDSDQQVCECDGFEAGVHQVCREVNPNLWIVDCWKGYYFDPETNQCTLACPVNYKLDDNNTCKRDADIDFDNVINCQVCDVGMASAALEPGADTVTCSCLSGYIGDYCDAGCPIDGDYDICYNNGTCAYTRETDSSYCSCDEGWYGQDCGQVCPLDPYYGLVCGGHGSCATSHGISECVCDQNWFGPSCAEKCPVDDKGVVC